MVQSLEKYLLKMKNNENITIIRTRKYKDINLYLRFSIYASPKQRACAFVLSRMMCETSTVHNTKESMQRVKDMLYGMSVSASCKTRADVFSYNVHYSFIHPKFVNEPLDGYLSFIDETLNHTLINAKLLNEAKRSIVSTLKRESDKPHFFAKERVVEIVGEDYPSFRNLNLSKVLIDDIKSLKVSDIKEFYKYLLESAQLHLYLSGDLDDEMIDRLTDFDFENRQSVKTTYFEKKYAPKKDITDKKKISQSSLAKVYQTPFDKKHSDFYAWKLGNYFLGVAPCSLLFEEVREKRSLCYSISAIEYTYYGLVKIQTSIDASKKDTVLEQIDIQIKRIIDQDYDVNKLNMAKALFINMLEGIDDDEDGLIDYNYESVLSDFNADVEEYKRKIMEVSQDDLTRVFKEYKPYFTYMLEGVNND